MNVRPLACVYCSRSAASVNLLIRSWVAQSTANYKLPLIIHFRGCSEADTALSIAQYSRTKALRCTLSVKHSQISKWCFSGAYFQIRAYVSVHKTQRKSNNKKYDKSPCVLYAQKQDVVKDSLTSKIISRRTVSKYCFFDCSSAFHFLAIF